MASRSVEDWQRMQRPLFRRRTAGGLTSCCGIHHEVNYADYCSRQRYYEGANLQCNVEALYARVENDMSDGSTQRERDAWVQGSIEQQHQIMSDVRAQPWPMEKKRKMLGLARQFIEDYETDVSFVPSRFELSYRLKKIASRWNAFWKWLIWGERIRRITCIFGSGVASYFKFLRWLCFLNFMLFLFIFSFICIPQLVYNDQGLQPPANYSYPLSLVVDGEGDDFEYSILFIGYYTNGRINGTGPENELGGSYKLPVAYIVVMFWAFLLSIVFIMFSMTNKHAIVERAKIRDVFPFSWRALATWDFSVTNSSSVLVKKNVLKRELQELVDEHLLRNERNKCVLYFLRFCVFLLLLVLYAGSGVAVYFTVNWSTDCPSVERANDVDDDHCYAVDDGMLESSQNLREFVNFLLDFRLPIVVALLNVCLSWIILGLVRIEHWTPRKENIVSLFRIFVLYVLNLAVLTYSLYTLSQDCGRDCCWETLIGQHIYRILIFELFSEVVSVLFVDMARGIIVSSRKIKVLSDWVDYPRFNLPKNTANLIYGQTLVWLGMFFCPLLPLIALLKDVVLFYLRSWTVRVFNNAPKHLYRAEAAVNYYLGLLLLLLLASSFPVGWAVTRLRPSQVCGPFRGNEFMINAIENEIEQWAASSRSSLSDFGKFALGLQTSGVVLPCFIILCIIAYYYYTRTASLKEVKKDLIIQLDVEKQKLRQRISNDAAAARKRQRNSASAAEPGNRLSQFGQTQSPNHDGAPTRLSNFDTPHEAMINDQMV